MKRYLQPGILPSLILIGIATGCNLPFFPASNTATPTATITETPAPVSSPTASGPTATPTPKLAPICAQEQPSSLPPSTCRAPIAEETSLFCTKKSPYNLLLVNAGATYEVLTRGFRCSNEGMKDDRQIVTCTGPMALPFEVRVCDPACAVPTVQAETTLCPQGHAFDYLLGCCTPNLPTLQPNCEVLKLKTKSCSVNCAEFTKQKTCNNNSFACEWDGKVCRLRR